MTRLRTGLLATLAVLGLSAGPAQAFGPMMLLMMPMMVGSHQHGSDAAHKDSTAVHAEAPQAPAPAKHDEPEDKGRLSDNPSTALRHVVPSDADRTDAEHGR